MREKLTIRHFKLTPYETSWRAMQTFTEQRLPTTPDELWILEHPPVFTQGLAGKPEHVLQTTHIPVIKTDRGGQVTYHGPGQLIIYVLLDLHRLKLSIRTLICTLERAVIDMLNDFGIHGHTIPHAPGVYVNHAKICSLGLRIRRGYSYHGLSFNVAMDLTPFSYINPCGYKDLKILQFSDLIGATAISKAAPALILHLTKHLGYTDILHTKSNLHTEGLFA